MEFILIAAGLFVIGTGLYLVADFAFWEAKGKKAFVRIEGFSTKRSLGLRLPIVVLEKDGEEIKVPAERIDQLVYILSRPDTDSWTEIIYTEEEGGRLHVRVRGYLRLVAGTLLLLVFLLFAGQFLGNSLAAMRAAFGLTFAAVLLGGFAVLKFIQRS
ncbi:MAG: hypothetical protein IT558_05910 [Alphaproteobacteria bacterium]|nr:hypothetical protein [Alphaproteobacteria bacterium]